MDKRNYGIDLLRIIAMFMVVILHCFTGGGLIDNCTFGTPESYVTWLMTIINYAGVNIFALISGYVAFYSEGKKVDYSRYFELWFEVVFYGILLNVVIGLVNPDYRLASNYISALMPVSGVMYWYFCAFTGLYVMKPLIDKGLSNLSEDVLKKFVVVLFLAFMLISTFSNAYVFNLGYTAFWLIVLYIVGYGINKCKLLAKLNSIKLILIILSMIIVSFALMFIIPDATIGHMNFIKNMFVVYTSPTIIMYAVCMVVLFSRIKIGPKVGKVISVVSPAAFAIYLVDCHPLFWDLIVKDAYMNLVNAGVGAILSSVFAFSIPLCIFVLMFDILRIRVFKMCMVDKLADQVEKALRGLVRKIAASL